MPEASIKLCFSICLTLIVSIPILAQKKVIIDWSVCAELPSEIPNTKHRGLAGAHIGIIKNTLIILGGANFPDKMPWDGGVKKYHSTIYILGLSGKKPCQWINTKINFPVSLAYGATVLYKNKLICIGGENENGPTDKIWQVSLNPLGDTVLIKELSRLPTPLTNLTANIVGHTLFIAGGESKTEVSNKLYSLDLKHIDKGFKNLSSVPVALSHAVFLSNSAKSGADLFLIGGRKKNQHGISTLYSSVFKYNVKSNTWTALADLPYALSALNGVTLSNNQIIILAGDAGETFSKTEEYLLAISAEKEVAKKQELINQKNHLQINHPGFSKGILQYDVQNNVWSEVGTFPYEAAVTTTALLWHKSILIPSGEIKAGIRTPKIFKGDVKQK